MFGSQKVGELLLSHDLCNEPLGRGTEIRLHLCSNAMEYLEEAKIKDVVEKYLASEVIDFPIHLLATQEVNPEVQASFVVEDSTRIRNDILLPTPPVVTNSSESLSFCWANEPQVRECYLGTHNPGRLTHAAGLSVSGKSAQLQRSQTMHASAMASSSGSHARKHFQSSESLSLRWASEPQSRDSYLSTHNPGALTHASGLSVSGRPGLLQSNQTLHAAATTSSSDSHRRDHFHDFPRLNGRGGSGELPRCHIVEGSSRIDLQKLFDMETINDLRENELEARRLDRVRKTYWLRFLILVSLLFFFHAAIIATDWIELKRMENEEGLVLVEMAVWFVCYVPYYSLRRLLDDKCGYNPSRGLELLNFSVHVASYVAFHYLKDANIEKDHFAKLLLAHTVSFAVEFLGTLLLRLVFKGSADDAEFDI